MTLNCSARNVIENSFGRLKGRFGCLKRAMDVKLDDLPHVIYTCFILNNFCERKGEYISDENVLSNITVIWMAFIIIKTTFLF